MPRTGVDDLLEVVVEPVVQPPPSQLGVDYRTPSRHRRWWPWAAAATAVALAIGALPVRSNLAVNEVRRLERQWAWFKALDGKRATLDALLVNQAHDPGEPRVVRGQAALAGQESALLRRARSQVLGGWHLPDHGLQQLRQEMGFALADQAADLADTSLAAPSVRQRPFERPTALVIAQVDDRLAAQLARLHQRPRTASVPVAPLTAADDQLRALARPTDQSVRARLVFAGPPGTLTSVDLSSGTGPVAVPGLGPPLHPVSGPVVPRAGYLAVGTAQEPFVTPVYAVSPDLSWLRVIGTTVGGAVVAAADPAGVWLQSGSTAVEVNGTGQTMRGPIAIGTNRVLVGATEQVLVTTGPLTFDPAYDVEIVSFEGAQQGHRTPLPEPARLVAATAGHLAWMAADSNRGIVIKVADGAAKGARTLTPPTTDPGPPAFPVDVGAFSPDNHLLAVRYVTNPPGSGPELRLAIADLASGTTRLLDGPIGDRPSGQLSWAPDGDHLFFNEASGSDVHIGTWQLGAQRTSVVRVPVQDLMSLTAIGQPVAGG